jgi:hypothetical protein
MATVLTYDHPIGRGARTATHQNRYNRIFREAAAVARVARFIYFNQFLKLFCVIPCVSWIQLLLGGAMQTCIHFFHLLWHLAVANHQPRRCIGVISTSSSF